MSPIANPQPIRSGAGWRIGQKQQQSGLFVGPSSSVPTVPLDTAVGQSDATLALSAPTLVTLGDAAAQSVATLALTVPAAAEVIPSVAMAPMIAA